MYMFYVYCSMDARVLLGNGLVNTPRLNTHKATMEDVSQGGLDKHVPTATNTHTLAEEWRFLCGSF
jgi:hypothetical protein